MELGYYTNSCIIIQYTDKISGIDEWALGLHCYRIKKSTSPQLKYHSAHSISQQLLNRLKLRTSLLSNVQKNFRVFFKQRFLIKKIIPILYGIIYK